MVSYYDTVIVYMYLKLLLFLQRYVNFFLFSGIDGFQRLSRDEMINEYQQNSKRADNVASEVYFVLHYSRIRKRVTEKKNLFRELVEL